MNKAQNINKEELDLLKKMAMADGVLSNNEKELFRSTIDMTDEEAGQFFAEIEAELESVQSETEVIDWKRKNGLDFEKFIVSIFPRNFKIQSWTSDKFSAGKYDARSLNPDIIVEVATPVRRRNIAIECKFHMGFCNDWVFVAKKEQLKRYKKFQEDTGLLTFIALGVGGSGNNPEELFVIPISALKYQIAKKSYLEQFRKNTQNKLFFIIANNTFR